MISWAEYNAQQKKVQAKVEQRKQEREGYLYYSEMCDVCGHNSLSIKRKSYLSKSGIIYTMRYCENCNPDVRWAQLKLY